MPRRHRAARDRALPPPPRPPTGIAPAGTQVPGYTVRQVARGEKEYLCPGCNQVIPIGVVHLVVYLDEEPDLRRHWHTPCWRREMKLMR